MQSRTPPYSSKEAFSELFEDSHLLVFRYIYALLPGPKEEVEDLTAETYWRAWRARKKFFGNLAAARGWLLKIARNLVIDTARKHSRRGFPLNIEDIDPPYPGYSPEEKLQLRQQVEQVISLSGQLSLQNREMLVLRYVLGWRVKDIGEHLDLPENTVSVALSRSIKKIQQSLQQDENNY